jgi:hypothetical protein
MEYIFIPILTLLLFGGVLGIVLLICRGSFLNKGDYGEKKISKILDRLPNEYIVFNDVYLINNGYSIQIDHVVISKYGVFVIETKNYTGRIYGSESGEYWTQNIYGHRYEFYNPVLQNSFHEKTIRSVLGISADSVIPLVVFIDKADLHCKTSSVVLYPSQLHKYIVNKKPEVFSEEDVKRMVIRLKTENIVTSDRKQMHIKSVRQSLEEREYSVSNRICPRCGGRLVERKGKYGQFLGCSNYPYCKFRTKLG